MPPASAFQHYSLSGYDTLVPTSAIFYILAPTVWHLKKTLRKWKGIPLHPQRLHCWATVERYSKQWYTLHVRTATFNERNDPERGGKNIWIKICNTNALMKGEDHWPFDDFLFSLEGHDCRHRTENFLPMAIWDRYKNETREKFCSIPRKCR